MKRRLCLATMFCLALHLPFTATQALAAEDATFQLGDGPLKLTAPEGWKKVKPQNRVIEHEFAIEPAEGDSQPGRATVTGAGGAVQANIDRWIGQFVQPDGSETKDKTKVEKKEIAGQEVHLVDITGTFEDKPGGPFAPGRAVQRPDYRMLAAIIVTKDAGSYFVKFYGPKKTVSENEARFKQLIDSLKTK